MSSRECEIQLNELIEAWELSEALLNQTDIEAIKHLLLENQIQQDVMIKYKLEIEKLKEVIEEVWNFIKKYPGISQSGVVTIKGILDKVGD